MVAAVVVHLLLAETALRVVTAAMVALEPHQVLAVAASLTQAAVAGWLMGLLLQMLVQVAPVVAVQVENPQ